MVFTLYFLDSHDSAQYPDGLRGPLIIRDPDVPYKDEIEDELILKLSDWYQLQAVCFISQTDSNQVLHASTNAPKEVSIRRQHSGYGASP
jgi:FtsP/CotA-like multicopper oxidase with cupredoxin domain